jgi:hypothetical protein
MGKYDSIAEEFISGAPTAPAKPGKYDAVAESFMGRTPIKRDQTPVKKRRVQWTTPGKDAGVIAHRWAGGVRDLKTKIPIYAEKMGIPPDRFAIEASPTGNAIVYQDDAGDWFPVTRQTIGGKLKEVVSGETHPLNLMRDAAAGLVATGGGLSAIPLAGLTAGGFEGIKQSYGALRHGEPQTATGNFRDIGAVGIGETLGVGVGKLIPARIAAKRMKKSGALRHTVGREVVRGSLNPDDALKAKAIRELADKHGIQLNPGQEFDSRALQNYWSYFRDNPQTAKFVQEFEKKQAKQVERAIRAIPGKIGSETDTSLAAGRLVDAADETTMAARRARSAKTSPKYKEAFETVPNVDISKSMGDIDSLIAKAPNGPAKSVLKRVRSFFTEEKTVEQVLRGSNGKMSTKKVKIEVPITNTEKIDWAKKQTDKYLKNMGDPDVASADSQTMRSIKELKDKILEEVDAQNPAYKEARRLHGDLTPGVDKVQRSVVGRIAKLKGKDDRAVMGSLKQLFDFPNTEPSLIKEAKKLILQRNNGEKVWDDAVGAYLRKRFKMVLKETQAGEVANAAGKARKSIWGSEWERDIWKEVLTPEQHRGMKEVMEVFRHASKGLRENSMTEHFRTIKGELADNIGSKAFNASMKPREALAKKVFGTWNDIIMSGKHKEVFEAFVDPKNLEKIKAIKRLPPTAEKSWQLIGSLLGVIPGSQTTQRLGRLEAKTSPAPTEERQRPTPGQSRLGTLRPQR